MRLFARSATYTAPSLEIVTPCGVLNCCEAWPVDWRAFDALSSGFLPYAPQWRLYAPVSASNTITRRLPYPSATSTSLVFECTVMPAGRLRCVVSLLSAFTPPLPICSRNLPSLVNFRICPSPLPLPVNQTLSLSSTAMPCSPLPGRPSPLRRRSVVHDAHSTCAENSPPRLNQSYWPLLVGPPH